MYKLDITKSAGKFISRLQAKQYRQVVSTIFKLRENPEPHDSKQMIGRPEYRRADIGEYRIIYRVKDAIRKAKAKLEEAETRRIIWRDAVRARDYLRSMKTGRSLARSGELNFLIKAIEKRGLK
ncbi:type II toxin-antitoxin system RelE/ParE family toxin [Desulfococcaceae bacterium HSG8]|nr:type II toxin-antitoxin system RelE/ParE family toxin [Desulfococcaceae bacterium HSG8]